RAPDIPWPPLPPLPRRREQWATVTPAGFWWLHNVPLRSSDTQVCGGQLWAIILGPPSGQPGEGEAWVEATRPAPQDSPTMRPGPRSHPKIHRKPSMSKVILGVLANKGKRSRVSQATLKKAVAATGYNMARNTGRFKLALTKLVDKGMLKQVTGKGASGSFRLSRKQASKFKLKAKKRQQRRRKSGQRRPRQRKSLLSSTEGQKQHIKGVRRVAKCPLSPTTTHCSVGTRTEDNKDET
uniref:Histone H1.9 n=1 Tax=Oryctolagus cuniculus TaxID=9986 RepID=G1T311_RABIT